MATPLATDSAIGTWRPHLPAGLRRRLRRLASSLAGQLLGSLDGHLTSALAWREWRLALRSRGWQRLALLWCCWAAGTACIPLLYRPSFAAWGRPSGLVWLTVWGYLMQLSAGVAMAGWSIRQLRADLDGHRLDELLLTQAHPVDITMGRALGLAAASWWLVMAAFPAAVLLTALGGVSPWVALRLTLTIAPVAMLGVWFGLGWGLRFSLRRPAGPSPLTHWWISVPLVPLIVAWAGLGLLTLLWGWLKFIPHGHDALGFLWRELRLALGYLIANWNPLLTVGAATGLTDHLRGHPFWLTNWLALGAYAAFMIRKSTAALQLSLGRVEEREVSEVDLDHWMHHNPRAFDTYYTGARAQPRYDFGSAIRAFDIARGHRVYLHPFLWASAITIWAFLLFWGLLAPHLARVSSLVAVLIPATGALLLMSGGVATSFGWERQQGRWPGLAALPDSNLRLALGKISAVVRQTLWVGMAAMLTALVLGWRGALALEPAYWTALHVLLFPVALAFVSAVLALTTPSLGEAIWRWLVLGSLPAIATVLPPPLGGLGGWSLPLSPPLLVLLINVYGPAPELVRAAWVALALEGIGVAGALWILARYLRRWTVGERP